jgi:glycosyltransferase 2 family protein
VICVEKTQCCRQATTHPLDGVAFDGVALIFRTQSLELCPVAGEFVDHDDELVGLLRLNEDSCHTIDHGVGKPFDRGSYYHRSPTSGLDSDQPEAFHVACNADVGHHGDVAPAHQQLAFVVVNKSKNPDSPRRSSPLRGGLDLGTHWPISGNQVDDVCVETWNDLLDEPRHSLPTHKAAKREEYETAWIEVELPDKLFALSRAVVADRERDSDAGMQHDDTSGVGSDRDSGRRRGGTDRHDPIGVRQGPTHETLVKPARKREVEAHYYHRTSSPEEPDSRCNCGPRDRVSADDPLNAAASEAEPRPQKSPRKEPHEMRERGSPKRDELDPPSPTQSVVDVGGKRLHPTDARWEAAGDEEDSRGGRTRSDRRVRLLRLILGLAGATGLTIAFVRGLHSSDLSNFPSPLTIVWASLCMIANVFLSAIAWAALFDPWHAPRLVRGYFFSLLGKYIPGAIWQAVGQVSAARRSGVSLAAASVAFPLQALGQVAAAGTLALVFAIEADQASLWVRIACALSVLSLVPLLNHSWISPTVALIGRLVRRPVAHDAVPPRGRVLASYGWSLAGLTAASVAFALVVRAMATEQPSVVLAASGFAAAWGVGLLAIPVPAGLGVREGALILALGSTVGSAQLIAASAMVRLVTVAAEIVVLGVTIATPPRGSKSSVAKTDMLG